MSEKLIYCVSLPPATISSVPIHTFAHANERLALEDIERYYSCCGKSICEGCVHSFNESENYDNICPFCNSDLGSKTDEDKIEEHMKRIEANDSGAMYLMAGYYYHGLRGVQQDQDRAMQLYARAADLGLSKAHLNMGNKHFEGGDIKKAKFHFEAAAMAGHHEARYNLGLMDVECHKIDRAVKHWTIAASAGEYKAMDALRKYFVAGFVGRDSIDATLAAYNNSCVEMRSKARDASIRTMTETMAYSGPPPLRPMVG
jgi:TPR repeat protein